MMIDDNHPGRRAEGEAGQSDPAPQESGDGRRFDANDFWGSDWPTRTLLSMASQDSDPQQRQEGEAMNADADATDSDHGYVPEPVPDAQGFAPPYPDAAAIAEAETFVPQTDFPEYGGHGQPEAYRPEPAAYQAEPHGFGRQPAPEVPAFAERAYIPSATDYADEGHAHGAPLAGEPVQTEAVSAGTATGFGHHAPYERETSANYAAQDGGQAEAAMAEIAALSEPFARWARSFRLFGALWLVLSLAFAGFLLLALLQYGLDQVSWIETIFVLGLALALAVTGFRAGLKAGGIARRLRQAATIATSQASGGRASMAPMPREDSTGLMRD